MPTEGEEERVEPPAPALHGWGEVWRAADFDLCLQRHTRGFHRLSAAGGRPGGIAVVTNERGELAMVQQLRLAVGETLWEFPRGFGDATDEDVRDTALREFAEETGLSVKDPYFLGWIWPDSGLLANPVGVVAATLRDSEPGQRDGEISELAWVSVATLQSWVAGGLVRDGMTLAAFALFLSFSGDR